MTLNEWKPKLIPAGVLLICYFVIPGIVKMFMGENDAIFARLAFSLIVQAGLGIALIHKLLGLEQPLNAEVSARLAKFSQPPAKTRELSEKISLAAVLILILIIVGPLAGEIFTGGLLKTLIKLAVLVYAGYMGYDIWKLAEPFMSYVPVPAPPEVPATPPAVPTAPSVPVTERRCAKCGQQIDDSIKFCAFCKHPTTEN